MRPNSAASTVSAASDLLSDGWMPAGGSSALRCNSTPSPSPACNENSAAVTVSPCRAMRAFSCGASMRLTLPACQITLLPKHHMTLFSAWASACRGPPMNPMFSAWVSACRGPPANPPGAAPMRSPAARPQGRAEVVRGSPVLSLAAAAAAAAAAATQPSPDAGLLRRSPYAPLRPSPDSTATLKTPQHSFVSDDSAMEVPLSLRGLGAGASPLNHHQVTPRIEAGFHASYRAGQQPCQGEPQTTIAACHAHTVCTNAVTVRLQ